MLWPEDIPGARKVQETLRKKVRISSLKSAPKLIAGVDAAFSGDRVIAACSLFGYPEIRCLEEAHGIVKLTFPYIPGFLSFREGPAIVEAIGRLKTRPDVILFDGQGIAHPKGIGIASHIGVVLGVPAIGCAKSRLVGEYEEPGPRKGDWTPLRHEKRIVGAAVRTRDDVRPLFVSPGHRITLKQSIDIVLRCCTKYRIPEPVRRADHLAREIKRRLS